MSEVKSTKSVPWCECGCGQEVMIARGGKPNRYLRGHDKRGKPKSESHRAKLSAARIGKPGPWLGKKMPIEARLKMSASKRGQTLTPEHRAKIAATMTGKPHPSIHHKQSAETKLKKSLAQRGDRGSGWKGGITAVNRCVRASSEFKQWRESVFRRDKYTCQHCGEKTGNGHRVELHPHHIKEFSKFVELRFEITNGLTLCKKCHDIVHGRA